jgi:hypothetical protein
VQRRPCRVRDGRLMRIGTIVWRQQHMASECDDRRVFSFGQKCSRTVLSDPPYCPR